MLVTYSFRNTGIYFTYGCPALNAAYDGKHYLQVHWSKLQVWVSNLTWSLCLLAVPSESLGYTTLISVQPQVKRMIEVDFFFIFLKYDFLSLVVRK